jgi:hypothetical protein
MPGVTMKFKKRKLLTHQHLVPGDLMLIPRPVLGGLHHDYSLVPKAA